MYFSSFVLLCDNGQLLCDNDRRSGDNDRLRAGLIAWVDNVFSIQHNCENIGPILQIFDVLDSLARLRSNFGAFMWFRTAWLYAINLTPDDPGIFSVSNPSLLTIQTQGFIDHHDNPFFFVLVLLISNNWILRLVEPFRVILALKSQPIMGLELFPIGFGPWEDVAIVDFLLVRFLPTAGRVSGRRLSLRCYSHEQPSRTWSTSPTELTVLPMLSHYLFREQTSRLVESATSRPGLFSYRFLISESQNQL